MKMILPILLALIGLGGGLGAGVFLYKPPPADEMATDGHAAAGDTADAQEAMAEAGEEPDPNGLDYIKLNNQFIVPLVTGGNVTSLVVVSLNLEVRNGNEELVYSREPRLRDAFLRVLFDHANAGGFSGDFTKSTNMMVLRDSLLEIARKNLGDIVTKVLIVDLVRQDI